MNHQLESLGEKSLHHQTHLILAGMASARASIWKKSYDHIWEFPICSSNWTLGSSL